MGHQFSTPHIMSTTPTTFPGQEILERQYFQTRETQMNLYGREFTEMDRKASQVIFDTALVAMDNVRSGKRTTCMQAVSLSTGVGKSTSAYAFIATLAKADPQFSAAYIVPTVKMAMEAQEGIEKLLGDGSTTLWSSYHKHKGVDERKALEELGEIPERRVAKADLLESRVVIVTHSLLKSEMEKGTKQGCTTYLGNPRSVVFIDEHPELLQLVETTPKKLQEFLEKLAELNHKHPWLPVVSQVLQRMNDVVLSDGQTYSPTELLSKEEGTVFEDSYGLSLWDDMTDDEVSDEKRYGQLRGMTELVNFLKAASQGNTFYSRNDWAFFSYQLHFVTDYPGFVLLDATSDLAGLVSLHPKVRAVEVPQVNYRNLELLHINLPPEFKRIKEVTKYAGKGRAYGEFIYQTVLANTSPDDDVLVVVHKDVLTQELIGGSDDPGAPMDWEGRKVNTQHWGAGVGLNKFKDKGHVFLFGEFYIPRARTIAETHGWSQRPMTKGDLRLAEGRRKAGDQYAPQGLYLKPHEGHLLRWSKQLAMRGTARRVDSEGNCYPMKLFTTLDLIYLLPNLDRLFPKVRAPMAANAPEGVPIAKRKGRQGLIDLLLSTTHKDRLGADEVEVITGIKTNKLAKEYECHRHM